MNLIGPIVGRREGELWRKRGGSRADQHQDGKAGEAAGQAGAERCSGILSLASVYLS